MPRSAMSLTALGEEFVMDRRTVRKRLEAAGVAPCGERHGHPVYPVGDAARALLVRVVASPDDLRPGERLAWFRSEGERIGLEERCESLLRAEDVRRDYAEFVKAMTAMLDQLPDLIERETSITAEQLEAVEKVLHEFREQAYQKATEDTES